MVLQWEYILSISDIHMIWATYSAHIQLGLHKSSIATHGTAFFCCCLHCLRLHHHREWIKILSPPSATFPIWKSIFPLHWLLIPRVRKRRKSQRQALKYEFQFDNTGMLICLHTHTHHYCVRQMASMSRKRKFTWARPNTNKIHVEKTANSCMCTHETNNNRLFVHSCAKIKR